MRRVVDLPAPLGPRKPCTSPSRTVRSSPSSARTDPKCLVSPRISMGTWWLSADMCFSLLSFGQEGLVHGAVGQQAFGVDLQGRQHHVVRVVA
ncbi:Uncharacterised protein [Mycobacterium tuberculosis]|uniref:Uncharacterized protein n=1 Tax=Mycobacterium tuberculosis TaxID=1773 RepID=A0A654ZTI2_MYCTX|nr:Uncharacterised protein [Mycobacterium tuberculosis]CKR71110.1 Uncharacterised protein [Mycobacterium tuberculosis]CKR82226.1 Uncharacterised protein [Mycobacterium tuberculosis]CKW63984.1 Uncharacterised protein [Mycobacterium tuberculosis]CNM86571.1 Uncharacterised protein [Mycobacterium tuberculosis]